MARAAEEGPGDEQQRQGAAGAELAAHLEVEPESAVGTAPLRVGAIPARLTMHPRHPGSRAGRTPDLGDASRDLSTGTVTKACRRTGPAGIV
jgi:hypothetical protein